MHKSLGEFDWLSTGGLTCVHSSAASLSSRSQRPSRFQLLLEKLKEHSIRAKTYSVSRYAKLS